MRELGDASVPFEFDVHAMISSEDAPALEHALMHMYVPLAPTYFVVRTPGSARRRACPRSAAPATITL